MAVSSPSPLNITQGIGVENSSSFTCEHPGSQEDLPRVAFYLTFSTMFFVGIVGNSMLVFIILRHKKMRTTPNKYILNLSLADLLITLTSALAPLLDNSAYATLAVCVLSQVVRETCISASIYTLVALSAERYHAIAFPLRRDTGMSASTVTTGALTAVWTLSITLGIGKIFTTEIKCTKSGSYFDLKDFANKYSIIGFLFVFFIPLALISLFYVLMARDLYLGVRNCPVRSDHKLQMERLIEVKKKMVWVVLALVVAFASSGFIRDDNEVEDKDPEVRALSRAARLLSTSL